MIQKKCIYYVPKIINDYAAIKKDCMNNLPYKATEKVSEYDARGYSFV